MLKYSFLFLFLSANLAAQSARLNLTLAVGNGKLMVHDATLKTDMKYPPNAQQDLVQHLNHSFYILDSLIKNDSVRWCAADGICYDLEEFKSDYLVLVENEGIGEAIGLAYLDFIDTSDEDHLPLLELFSENIFFVIQNVAFNGSPIDLIAEEFEEEDYEFLSFYFEVKPPINVADMTILWLDKDTLKNSAKNAILKDLDGQLFFEHKIVERLNDYFYSLNFYPTYFIDADQIRILPPRFSRLLVTTEKSEDLDLIAYFLLPHQLYKSFLELPKDSLKIEELSKGNLYRFNILDFYTKQADKLPILLTKYLPQYYAQLSQQGYILGENNTPNSILDDIVKTDEQELFRDLSVQPIQPSQDSTTISAATPNITDENTLDEFTNGNYNNATKTTTRKQATTPHRNFIGLGVDIYFKDAARLKTVFQRLLKDGSTISLELAYAFNEAGVDEGGLIMSGSYAKDYLFFDALKKRLSLQISAGSDFTANRIFNGQAIKERRTGGVVRTEIDWYRDQSNCLFRSYWNIADEVVILKDFADTEILRDNVLSTEWGNLFYHSSPIKLFASRWTIENKLKIGWQGLEEVEKTFFAKGSIQAQLNQKLSKGRSLDITTYGEWASSNAPVFEQIGHLIPRNRGFRQDVVVGRSLWGGTAEVWLPLPKIGTKHSKLNQYLYQHFCFALFSDFSSYGNLLNKPFQQPVQLWSFGGGLRMTMGIAQVNFDWALRQSRATALSGGSLFSIDLKLNSPFQ